uniref:Uncharacterized protein n=1 Tax=Glossina brevipalpis TaxID=37001 RepID=A0A1A9WG53_9MUSC
MNHIFVLQFGSISQIILQNHINPTGLSISELPIQRERVTPSFIVIGLMSLTIAAYLQVQNLKLKAILLCTAFNNAAIAAILLINISKINRFSKQHLSNLNFK